MPVQLRAWNCRSDTEGGLVAMVALDPGLGPHVQEVALSCLPVVVGEQRRAPEEPG